MQRSHSLLFLEVIAELKKRFDHEAINDRLNNHFVFKVEDTLRLVLHETEDKRYFYLSSVVFQPPIAGKDRKAILSICLEANFFGQGTNGATFAFDRFTNEVIFFRTFLVQRTKITIFLNALNDLIVHVKEWRKRFQAKDYYGTWRQGYRGMGESDIQPFWTRV